MASEGEIVVYHLGSTLRLGVKGEGSKIWLNWRQMVELFGRGIKTIDKHIANALREELNPDFANVGSFSADVNGIRQGMMPVENPVVAKFATTAADGKVYQVEHYNLEVIVSVGFRVKSPQGILFRRWANEVLKRYMTDGCLFWNEPKSSSLKVVSENLKVKYAFQVAVDTDPSSINPLDYEDQPVKIAFADLAKVLI